MIDITHKSNTLRVATAQAIVKVSKYETIEAINNNAVPKGDVFAMSKAAGLLGIKKTPELLPDCHPMPIEYTGVEYSVEGLEVTIRVTVKTIYKTGVEVEAMHGASIVALNMYDMLKPIDKGVEIHYIKLLEKTGGKSSYPIANVSKLRAGIVVCSDSLSAGKGKDNSGEIIQERMLSFGLESADVQVVEDDLEMIENAVKQLIENYQVIILTGGTGLSNRDVTPEAILPLLDKRLIGAEETIRRFGQERMPYAMLSRSVVGTIGKSLVLALPGSSKGVVESLDAVFPALFHSFKVLDGERH
ncbi:bifunctional molybdenum cofactor biosynthesis protein MoaC/MoaB [Bacteroidia bacterium]|nr:bifunctional molybdenum cofactor biosynthesis protein MoaC/MoaB [Bacteroidia bacterium]MDB9882187.1 bifunctional molybdenum cofactor biosynthesis protein MoaC/MoaB [Bacteroidia bacterium]MDC1395379.1 bifunctional molybdenum cofactor biosynthesis protein MoaC/MoaB [Bacteroidia bacterium]